MPNWSVLTVPLDIPEPPIGFRVTAASANGSPSLVTTEPWMTAARNDAAPRSRANQKFILF